MPIVRICAEPSMSIKILGLDLTPPIVLVVPFNNCQVRVTTPAASGTLEVKDNPVLVMLLNPL